MGGIWRRDFFKSLDHGESWRIYRTAVPLDPSDLPPIIPRDQVPRVSAYAYPNPFSPSSDRLTRLRFDLSNPESNHHSNIRFRNEILSGRFFFSGGAAGANEVAWDGTDEGGVRLANGTYFYAILSQKDTFWGKNPDHRLAQWERLLTICLLWLLPTSVIAQTAGRFLEVWGSVLEASL